MIDVALAPVASQSLFVQLDERAYSIAVRDTGSVVVVDIERDGVQLVRGMRAAPSTPLLPYAYQEAGNFVLTTEGDDLPAFAQFGVTQFLVYLSDAEIAALRG